MKGSMVRVKVWSRRADSPVEFDGVNGLYLVAAVADPMRVAHEEDADPTARDIYVSLDNALCVAVDYSKPDVASTDESG